MGRVVKSAGGVVVVLNKHERRLLGDLVGSMLELLEDGGRGDPALQRLFPDAYDSAEQAGAWHDLVGDELQRDKVSALTSVKDALERKRIELDEPESQVWLRALNDVRLAIGARLEVTEEMMGAEPDKDDPQTPTMALLHWLGWLQESMLRALMPRGAGSAP